MNHQRVLWLVAAVASLTAAAAQFYHAADKVLVGTDVAAMAAGGVAVLAALCALFIRISGKTSHSNEDKSSAFKTGDGSAGKSSDHSSGNNTSRRDSRYPFDHSGSMSDASVEAAQPKPVAKKAPPAPQDNRKRLELTEKPQADGSVLIIVDARNYGGAEYHDRILQPGLLKVKNVIWQETKAKRFQLKGVVQASDLQAVREAIARIG